MTPETMADWNADLARQHDEEDLQARWNHYAGGYALSTFAVPEVLQLERSLRILTRRMAVKAWRAAGRP